MKARTLSIIVAAFAALTLAGCSLGSRGDDATSATTTPTTTPDAKVTEGSFVELRKTCNVEDRKIFVAVVKQFSKYPKVTDTPATAPYKDELKVILSDPENEWYAVAVAFSSEGSCLKAFVPYLPAAQSTSSGNGNGGNGGGSSGGHTQPTVGGSNCSNGNIDPDGTGPRGCEPTVPSDVGAGGGTPTQPVPPPASPATTQAPASPNAPTQPVVVIDENGQPVGTAPPVTAPPASPPPGTCWVIDGVEFCS